MDLPSWPAEQVWGVTAEECLGTVFLLMNIQLTIPAGLGWDESLESLKVFNSSFQFNYWSPNSFESSEVDFQRFKFSQ